MDASRPLRDMSTISTTTKTSASTAGGVRARNRQANASTTADDVTAPSFSNHLISPLPSPRPSRVSSPAPQTSSSRTGNAIGKGAALGNSPFTTGLFEQSWTTIQGLASSILGADAGKTPRDIPSAASARAMRRKRPSDSRHRRTFSTTVEGQWGPNPDSRSRPEDIAKGFVETREALVRAKRREDLLSANGHVIPDATGRFKRRMSDDRGPSSSAPPVEHDRESERDVLVYVHHVQPRDTLAGVIIQFNCQPAVFKKANRLWPNDTIQVRKTVLLPVEACAVKGRPLPEPSDVDLLDTDFEGEGFGNTTSGETQKGKAIARDSSVPPSISSQSQTHEEPPWQHASWVSIDGHPKPVEIARISRRTLGWFPPSRRKSVSFSDLDTPSASLDLPRLSSSHRDLASPSSSVRTGKHRSGSASYFAQQLQGPGGVGRLGAGVTSPGPEQDRFNKYLAPHLPSMAPRNNGELISIGENAVVSSPGSAAGGLENVGGAIEGWMRKVARNAASFVDHPPNLNLGSSGTGTSSNSIAARRERNHKQRREGLGDLIELTGGIDVGSGDDSDASAPQTHRGRSAPGAENTSGTSRDTTFSVGARRRETRPKGD